MKLCTKCAGSYLLNIKLSFGTTRTEDMVWLIDTDCNFVGAKRALTERFPLLEYDIISNLNYTANETENI